MLRRLIPAAALGLLVGAVGCHHIGGKCDAGAHPDDAIMAPPHNPYPYQPVTGPVTAPPKAPDVLPKDAPAKDKDGK